MSRSGYIAFRVLGLGSKVLKGDYKGVCVGDYYRR